MRQLHVNNDNTFISVSRLNPSAFCKTSQRPTATSNLWKCWSNFIHVSCLLPWNDYEMIISDSLCWCSNYEFTNRIPFHNVSFGAADHHDDLSLEGDDQHWALVHHLTHRQLQWTNKWNENSTLCWYGYCHLNDILCVNVCQEVKAENWRNHSKYYFGNLQTQ